jgi:NhaP-type Na+/H+ or K+/H+ antiporter
MLYQCLFGIFIGIVIGHFANSLLRYCDNKNYVGRPSYLVFYLLLAVFVTGVASTLGVDDFLVAFSAGATFSRDGWFAGVTAGSHLANVIDLLLNSTMFVFFGASIPWAKFTLSFAQSDEIVTPWRLFGLLILILLFRRIPAVLLLTRWIPDIKTWGEALFCGHFGPMGIGALFLAIQARAQLENDTSTPDDQPPPVGQLPGRRGTCVQMIWPVICFVVLGSIMVHGLSTLAVSVGIHFRTPEGERAPLIGGETGHLGGMIHSDDEEEEGFTSR